MAANRSRFSVDCRLSLPVVLFFARLLLACLLITSSAAPLSAAAASGQTDAAAVAPVVGEYVLAEVLIGWQAGTAAATGWPAPARAAQTPGTTEYQSAVQTIAARTGLRVLEAHLGYAAARLAVPAGQEQAEIARLVKLPGVRYAELNYIARAAVVPSDPLYSQQWNMARVNAPAAWDLTTGSNSVIVAVIDSGIDSGHAEFTGRLLVGPGSGAHDFIAGDDYPIDDFGHGTHVAGILAAGINGVGVVGLAPHVRILPLKVLDSQGNGTYDNIVAAINWAADWSVNFPHPGDPNARVRVINLSLGGLAPSQPLQDAVNHAISQGIVVVAAAGNCGQGCQAGSQYLFNPDFYPAACSGVLAVGATDRSDNWASSYSGYKSYVALSAPGGIDTDPILSTLPYAIASTGYGYEYGTSMAAPLVSGAAALAWSLWPAAAPAQISAMLTASADKVPLNDAVCAYDNIALQHSPCFGYGRLNALRVARSAYPPSLRLAFTQPVFLFDPNEAVAQRTYTDALLNPSERVATWQATVISGAQWFSSVPDGMTGPTPSTYSTPGILSLTAQRGQLQPGIYTGVVQVRSVFPPGLAANFNITATLVISSLLYHVYSPVLAK